MTSDERTVVVTGANRGIGLEVVRGLVEEGYRIAACVREPSDRLLKLLGDDESEHRFFELDLSDDEKIAACAKAVLNWSDELYGLVNCAGAAHGGLFMMTRLEDLKALYQVNLFGPLFFTQLLTRKMIRKKSGSIVNMSSTAGVLSDMGTLAYGGSKAALSHSTRVLATELGSYGIRVNAIAPSVVETDMAGQMDEAARSKLDERSAIPGVILPEDVGELVRFLLSDGASKITGQLIRLDRGMPF